MQKDDADSMLIKTLDKVNQNLTTWISCRTETFGFSHLRQGESSIPLTGAVLTEILQTHLQWNRASCTGRDESSLSLELPCYFEETVDWTSLGVFKSPTHTLIFPYKPAPPNTSHTGSACSITPMQHSAKQIIKICSLLKGLWNKGKNSNSLFCKYIILSKENADEESHLNFTLSFPLGFLKAQASCRSRRGWYWRHSVALG